MSARLAKADARRDRQHTCSAPSCWEDGDRIEIVDDDIDNPPVLCELHRKSYLGVST